jgi:hypothetical protein
MVGLLAALVLSIFHQAGLPPMVILMSQVAAAVVQVLFQSAVILSLDRAEGLTILDFQSLALDTVLEQRLLQRQVPLPQQMALSL